MSYQGSRLNHAFFAKLDFLSGPAYVWQGFRKIEVAGQVWLPVGPKATVEQIDDPVGDNVPGISFKVSGVDTSTLAAALGEADEIQNRLATVYDQFFDKDLQPTGSLKVFAVARMDSIKVSRQQNSDGSYDQVITVSAENFLTNGPYPSYGRYSSEDQWARLGNNADLYFQFMMINQNRRQRWPTY